MRKISILFLLIIAFCSVRAQQDINFSIDRFNNIVYNPSSVGNSESLNTLFIKRNQWVGMDVYPHLSLVNVDMPFKLGDSKHGIGLLFMNEKYGDKKNARFNLRYAYKKKLWGGDISFGVSLGMIYDSFKGDFNVPDYDISKIPEQTSEGSLTSLDVSKTNFDLGLGFSYRYNNLTLGFSAIHLMNTAVSLTDQSEYYYKKNCFVYINYQYSLTDKIYLLPSCLLNTDFSSEQYSISTKVSFNKRYSLGVSYRDKKTLVLLGELSLFSGFKLGYAYDVDNSEYGKSSNGSHEFYLSYSCPIKVKPKRQKFKSVRFL